MVGKWPGRWRVLVVVVVELNSLRRPDQAELRWLEAALRAMPVLVRETAAARCARPG